MTLVTGADGHVGQATARWLLRHTEEDLLLWVHAGRPTRLGDLAAHARCRVASGDLADARPFAGIDPRPVTRILHCAAVTNFAVDEPAARAINVDGTAKLIDFAATCASLERFGLVSSIYAAGLREGDVGEATVDDSAGFANRYEWSKWQAESLLSERTDLPWQIYRVATILGEDGTGGVVQQNAVHNTLRLLYYGLLSVIPGEPGTRIYLVSSEFTAAALGRLLTTGDARSVYHVSDSGGRAITLQSLADTVYDAFLADASFAGRRILKPLFCDQASFETLAHGTRQFGGVLSQALDSVAPFAPQLYRDKNVLTDWTTAALGGERADDSRQLLAAVCRQLIDERWGTRSRPTGDAA